MREEVLGLESKIWEQAVEIETMKRELGELMSEATARSKDMTRLEAGYQQSKQTQQKPCIRYGNSHLVCRNYRRPAKIHVTHRRPRLPNVTSPYSDSNQTQSSRRKT